MTEKAHLLYDPDDCGTESTIRALRNYAQQLTEWRNLRRDHPEWALGEKNLVPTLSPHFERARMGLELHLAVDIAKRFKERHDDLLGLVNEADKLPSSPRTSVPTDDADWMRRVQLDVVLIGQAGPCEMQIAYALELAEKIKTEPAEELRMAAPRSADDATEITRDVVFKRLHEAGLSDSLATFRTRLSRIKSDPNGVPEQIRWVYLDVRTAITREERPQLFLALSVDNVAGRLASLRQARAADAQRRAPDFTIEESQELHSEEYDKRQHA